MTNLMLKIRSLSLLARSIKLQNDSIDREYEADYLANEEELLKQNAAKQDLANASKCQQDLANASIACHNNVTLLL